MKKCHNCGFELEDKALFCEECGAKQEVILPNKVCPSCGRELPGTAKFCMECGTPISQVQHHSTTKISYNTSPQDNVLNSIKNRTPDVEVSQIDENTISVTVKGIPFNLKLVKGREYGTKYEIIDFYLGETPVTQGLWMAVMGTNPSENNEDLNYPVTNLDYSLISAFLIKLHKLTGFKFELPLREQWKYAYKGGAESKGYKFSGSNTREEIGWGDDKLHPVGELYSNEIGLYDMEGLVDELAKYKRIIRSSLKLGQPIKNELTGVRLIANINLNALDNDDTQLQYLINHRGKEVRQLRDEAIKWMDDNPKEKKKIENLQKERNIQNGFKEGLRPFMVNGKYGYIDPTGNMVVEPQFDRAWAFYEGLAVVEMNEKRGYINTSGKIVIKPQYSGVSDFAEGLAAVRYNGKDGFIDKKGNWVISPQYDDAYSFSEGLACVEKRGKSGYINKKGEIIIPLKYDFALSFKNGVAKVSMEDGPYLYLNPKGEILKDYENDEDEDEWSDGLLDERDEITKNWGFIGEDGYWVIEPAFWGTLSFSDGFGEVCLKEKGEWQDIDRLDIIEF